MTPHINVPASNNEPQMNMQRFSSFTEQKQNPFKEQPPMYKMNSCMSFNNIAAAPEG
jgi:hypothetical protein